MSRALSRRSYLSGGATGTLYEELLRDQNIRQHRFPMAGPVRISLMVREQTTGLEYRFIPEGPTVSGNELAPMMGYVTSFEGDFLVASGSLPGRGAARPMPGCRLRQEHPLRPRYVRRGTPRHAEPIPFVPSQAEPARD